jgi:hypothetical protein
LIVGTADDHTLTTPRSPARRSAKGVDGPVALKRDQPDPRHYLFTLERRVRHLTERVKAQNGSLQNTAFGAREIESLEWAIRTCWRVLDSQVPRDSETEPERAHLFVPQTRTANLVSSRVITLDPWEPTRVYDASDIQKWLATP